MIARSKALFSDQMGTCFKTNIKTVSLSFNNNGKQGINKKTVNTHLTFSYFPLWISFFFYRFSFCTGSQSQLHILYNLLLIALSFHLSKSWASEQVCKIEYLYSVCASCTIDGVPMYLEGTTIYTTLARSFYLWNSEMVTSNHNTTQVKWNIWLLSHLHSGGNRDMGPTIAQKMFFLRSHGVKKKKHLIKCLSEALNISA